MAKKRKHYRETNGSGSWYLDQNKNMWRYSVTVNIDGDKKRKAFYGKTKAECENKYKVFTEANSDYVVEYSISSTIVDIAKRKYTNDYLQGRTKIAAYKRNMESIKKIEDSCIGRIPINDVSRANLDKFLSDITYLSQSYINKIWQILKKCYSIAEYNSIVDTNPFKDDEFTKPKSKKETRKIRGFTVEEQKLFIKALEQEKSKYANQFLISIFAGMRMGEVNALKFDDINLNQNTINVDKTISKGEHGEPYVSSTTKTDKGIRNVPINKAVNPTLVKLLNDYKPTSDGMLFHTTTGTLVSTTCTNTEFKRIIKKYNIIDHSEKGEITQHSLRHTYATRCIEGKMPPKVLQTLLGHADISITLNTYSDVFNKFKTESIDKVDKYLADAGIV